MEVGYSRLEVEVGDSRLEVEVGDSRAIELADELVVIELADERVVIESPIHDLWMSLNHVLIYFDPFFLYERKSCKCK